MGRVSCARLPVAQNHGVPICHLTVYHICPCWDVADSQEMLTQAVRRGSSSTNPFFIQGCHTKDRGISPSVNTYFSIDWAGVFLLAFKKKILVGL